MYYSYCVDGPLVKRPKTPPFHGGNTGSNPVRVTKIGRLAQLGERLPYKQDVGSSILSSPTKIRPRGVVVNMPACHAGDRRFKSDRGRHPCLGSSVGRAED